MTDYCPVVQANTTGAEISTGSNEILKPVKMFSLASLVSPSLKNPRMNPFGGPYLLLPLGFGLRFLKFSVKFFLALLFPNPTHIFLCVYLVFTK